MVRNHDFDNRAKFAEYIEALKLKNSTVAQFEAAGDAIISGV